MKKISIPVAGLIALGAFTVSGGAVDFEKDVFPILKSKCGKCHMDGETKGDIALDKHLIAKEIGDGCIVPGDVKKSDLHWTMTLSPDDDEMAMPPKGARVPPEQIALIATWIEEGAKLGSSGEASPAGGGDEMTGDNMSGDSMSGEAGAAGKGAPKPYKGIFKNNKGKQVPATLTRIDGDRAILVLPDGKEYRYPIAMFAPETQDLVKKFQAGTLSSEKEEE